MENDARKEVITTTYDDLRRLLQITHMLRWDNKMYVMASCLIAENEDGYDPVGRLTYHFAAKILEDTCRKPGEHYPLEEDELALIFNALGLPGFDDYLEEQ